MVQGLGWGSQNRVAPATGRIGEVDKELNTKG